MFWRKKFQDNKKYYVLAAFGSVQNKYLRCVSLYLLVPCIQELIIPL
jgi:hypothetical protein